MPWGFPAERKHDVAPALRGLLRHRRQYRRHVGIHRQVVADSEHQNPIFLLAVNLHIHPLFSGLAISLREAAGCIIVFVVPPLYQFGAVKRRSAAPRNPAPPAGKAVVACKHAQEHFYPPVDHIHRPPASAFGTGRTEKIADRKGHGRLIFLWSIGVME